MTGTGPLRVAPYYADDAVTLWHGDCLEMLATLPGASVDAVVTDPPYGLEFMGKEWDSFGGTRNDGIRGGTGDRGILPGYGRGGTSEDRFAFRQKSSRAYGEWCEAWAAECLRVLKPGGHMLAFGGTRTWHRLACAVEDAGFEVRDSIAWLYGSGFPKSLDVSKAIDKDNGRRFEDRFALGRHIRERREALELTHADVNGWFGYRDGCQHWERQDRSGARVPTLADWRVLRERLHLSDEHLPLVEREEAERTTIGQGRSGPASVAYARENANVYDVTAPATEAARQWQGWGTALKPAFEPIVVARKPLTGTVAGNVLAYGTGALNITACRVGTAERPGGGAKGSSGFVDGYDGGGRVQPTAGRWPANVVLDDVQAAELDQQSGTSASRPHDGTGKPLDTQGMGWGFRSMPGGFNDSGGASRFFPVFRYEPKAPTTERPRDDDGTAHPTVKPLDLIRWLVRLVTPPGGTVLDPFLGSGTTAEACIVEGFRCIGVERDETYLRLAAARLAKPIAPVLFGEGV